MIELLTIGLALLTDRAQAERLEKDTEWSADLWTALSAFDQSLYYLDHDDLDLPENFRGYKALLIGTLKHYGLTNMSPVLYIGEIDIPQDLRERGVGKAMVKQIETDAKKRGAKGSVLYSTDTGSGPSQGFWERMGYHVVFSSPYESAVMYKDFR